MTSDRPDTHALHARARDKGVNPLVYWLVRAVLQPVFHLYFRLSRIGREHIPESGPVILCSNHRSFLDPFVIGTCLRRPVYYVAKQELFRNRFVAWLLNSLGAFPVVRGTGDQDMLATAKAILERGDAVLMFAEGTRIRPGALGRPKRGVGRLALETGAPVVPVAVIGTERVRNGWRFRPHKVRIRIGAPLTFPRVEQASRALAAAVTDRIWPHVMLQWEWLGGLPPLRRAAVIGAGRGRRRARRDAHARRRARSSGRRRRPTSPRTTSSASPAPPSAARGRRGATAPRSRTRRRPGPRPRARPAGHARPSAYVAERTAAGRSRARDAPAALDGAAARARGRRHGVPPPDRRRADVRGLARHGRRRGRGGRDRHRRAGAARGRAATRRARRRCPMTAWRPQSTRARRRPELDDDFSALYRRICATSTRTPTTGWATTTTPRTSRSRRSCRPTGTSSGRAESDGRPLRPWLIRIAHNLAANYYRDRVAQAADADRRRGRARGAAHDGGRSSRTATTWRESWRVCSSCPTTAARR